MGICERRSKVSSDLEGAPQPNSGKGDGWQAVAKLTYEMSGSCKENGLMFGETLPKMYPTTPQITSISQSKAYDRASTQVLPFLRPPPAARRASSMVAWVRNDGPGVNEALLEEYGGIRGTTD